MLLNFSGNLTAMVIAIIIMIMALIFHNVFQSFIAARMGDHSPRLAGFMAFDPGRHLELFGIILLVILGFGWPRQIPVNSRNYRGKREALVWYSGPLAYVIVAFICYLAAELFGARGGDVTLGFLVAGYTALLHAAINLFPILPLDGGYGAMVLGNTQVRQLVRQIAGYGSLGFIVLFLLLSLTGVTNALVGLLQNLVLSVLRLVTGIF